MATERDAQGFRKVLAAVITAFTGVSDLYESPAKPDLEFHTDRERVQEPLELAIAVLQEPGYEA